ncbi:MAG: response regulator [bacterium]
MKKVNKKILIVEDDPNFTSILKEKFSEEGFLIFTAQDGKEGLRASEAEKPDLIISDILLPRLSGMDMAKQIRAKNASLPIVLLTNVKDTSYLEKTKKMGKADYLIKSDIRLDDIVEVVKKRLKVK